MALAYMPSGAQAARTLDEAVTLLLHGCVVYLDSSDTEIIRAMASQPALLDACKTVVRYYREVYGSDAPEYAPYQVCAAAIQQATGANQGLAPQSKKAHKWQ